MNILGINDSHGASACILVDGRLLAAVQEERLNRVKNWQGFPAQSIATVLEISGLDVSDIDVVALSGLHSPVPKSKAERMQEYAAASSPLTNMKRIVKLTPAQNWYRSRRRRERLELIEQVGIPSNRVVLVEHHLAHAAAAYYGWGNLDEDILVLTCDGAGDRLAATVNVGRNGKLERLASVAAPDSLGHIYSRITFLLGMVPLEHEYKLMGMSPYAPEEGTRAVYELLKDLLQFDSVGGLTWSRTNGCPDMYYSYTFLRDLLERKRFDWISGGVQRFTEDMLVQWVRNCVHKTSIRRVALGGGVFMNVKANKAISEMLEVEDLFVFPSCGDETNSIGAAYWVQAQEEDEAIIEPIGPLYLGPAFDDAAVRKALDRTRDSGWSYEQIEDIEVHTARLLSEGQIVARCKGRSEFGARALGNRSILADPTKPEVIRVINDMIKGRDFWMPFAPSILEERADDYIVNPKQLHAPYMILAFDTTSRLGDLQAAIHPYDRTARPQVVRESWNPEYHRLLEGFDRLTDRAVVLNTSFNLHGYPIVQTPEDALDVFANSRLQYLALGNYIVHKG